MSLGRGPNSTSTLRRAPRVIPEHWRRPDYDAPVRYLFQAPEAPLGAYGSIETNREEPFAVGQPYNRALSRGGTTDRWVVAAIEQSPRPGYDGLIVFAQAEKA